MTLAMKSWLPETALEQCPPEPLLARVLQHWSDHWLIDAQPCLAALYQDDWPLFSASLKWRTSGEHCIAYREPAHVLASAMLGCSIIPATLQATDRRILEAMTRIAIDDLLRRVGEISGTNGQELSSSSIDPASCAWWEVSLGASKPAFKLAVCTSALAQLIKSGLPKADQAALEPVRSGLAKQDVRLEAYLGRCIINLAELKELGVGDVLVLDQLTDTPITVTVDSQPTPFRATLDEIEGHAVLVVAPKEKSNV